MRFRLLSAHYWDGDAYLPGDKEMFTDHGPERGTIVGDGTPYKVTTATLEMVPLDDEAEDLLEMERKRLSDARAAMNPIEQLPLRMSKPDNYDARYIPGFPGVKRPEV